MAKTEPHIPSRCRCGGGAKPEWANDYLRHITWHRMRCNRCGAATEPSETIWQAYADWERMVADDASVRQGLPEEDGRVQADL